MATLEIRTIPDPILQQPCEPVTEFSNELGQFLDDMYETMVAADGVGIAAPQVGHLKQVAIVDIGDGKIEFINPVVMEKRGIQMNLEEYRDRNGKTYIMEAEDFLAQAIQHELDHLQGILFTTKVDKIYTEEELERLDVE